jgi:hypothetical protein
MSNMDEATKIALKNQIELHLETLRIIQMAVNSDGTQATKDAINQEIVNTQGHLNIASSNLEM